MAQRKVLVIDAGHQAFDELDAADIPGGAGSPTDADYLVGTANAGLSAEIVVGTTPGGELGGTWASPTVDASHSGSTHAGLSGQPGSTDVAVADGGTGSSTAANARTALGLVIGTDVRAQGSGDPTVPAFATPAIVLGSAAAAGAASTVIRSDGTIAAFDATVPVTQAFSDAAATGSAAFAARRDHKHGMPANPETGATVRVLVPLDTPDASGNGYPALSTNNGFSNVRRVVPAFTKSVDGTWEGAVRIPADYASAGAIVCSFVANATSGAIRSQVSTAVAAVSVTEDTAYTAETATNTTVPGTAKQRLDITTTLTTTPVANSTLNVKIARIGTNGGDTLAVDALLWECLFQYVSA